VTVRDATSMLSGAAPGCTNRLPREDCSGTVPSMWTAFSVSEPAAPLTPLWSRTLAALLAGKLS
jgi:hypothetical protein